MLDFLPILAFFAVYQWQGMMWAVGTLMVAQAALIGIMQLQKRKPTAMHYGTLVVVLVFGGLTLLLRDPVFILVKPSIIFGGAALALAVALLLRRNPMRGMLATAIKAPIADEHWRRMGWEVAGWSAALGMANLVLAYMVKTQAMEEGTWVTIKTFAFPVVTTVVFTAEIFLLFRRANVPWREDGPGRARKDDAR